MGIKIPFLHQLQLNYGSVVSYYRPADTLWCPLCIFPLPQHRVGGTLRWTMGPSSRRVTRRSTPTLLTAPGWSLLLLASASKSTSPCFRCTGLTTSSPSGKIQRFLLAELFWSVNIKCATVSIRNMNIGCCPGLNYWCKTGNDGCIFANTNQCYQSNWNGQKHGSW